MLFNATVNIVSLSMRSSSRVTEEIEKPGENHSALTSKLTLGTQCKPRVYNPMFCAIAIGLYYEIKTSIHGISCKTANECKSF